MSEVAESQDPCGVGPPMTSAGYQQIAEGTLEERAVPLRTDYAWPMIVGKTWEQTYTRERPLERQTEEFTIVSTIASEETVSVPGGTFRASLVLPEVAQ